jgi:hypothetical protein
MEMGGHIQRREELRAEGKLKNVIDSILKKARIHLDLSCFVMRLEYFRQDWNRGTTN